MGGSLGIKRLKMLMWVLRNLGGKYKGNHIIYPCDISKISKGRGLPNRHEKTNSSTIWIYIPNRLYFIKRGICWIFGIGKTMNF